MLHCIADKAKLIIGLFSWSYSTADDLLTSWVLSALIVAEKFQHFHFVCNYDKTGRSVSNLWNQDFSASYSATSIFSNLHILIRPPDKFNFWAAKVWFLFLQILQVRTTKTALPFMEILVELKNSVFVNSTIISTNIKTVAVLSRTVLW